MSEKQRQNSRTIAELLDYGDLAVVAAQTAAARAKHGNPYGLLAGDGTTPRISLREASLANHGRRFHERVIEPLVTAYIPGGSGMVAAQRRALVGAPLYTPTALWLAATGRAPLTNRRMAPLTDRDGRSASAVVAAILERIADRSHVETIDAGAMEDIQRTDGGYRVTFASACEAAAAHPIIATEADELHNALGLKHPTAAVRTTMLWIDVPERYVKRLHTVTFLDGDVLRITPGSVSRDLGGRIRRVFCCELRHHGLPSAGAAAIALRRSGQVDDIGDVAVVHHESVPVFALPSTANTAAQELLHRQVVMSAAGLTLLGPADPTRCSVASQQIVDALAVVAQRTPSLA